MTKIYSTQEEFMLSVKDSVFRYEGNVWDFKAQSIVVKDIWAQNIVAQNINARNIDYYAYCLVYESIKCRSIKGRRASAKHFVLDDESKKEAA
jgi:hypothetical protein